MRYVSVDVVFQEVPGEISLAYTISGCPNKCKDCHSSYTWDPNGGSILTKEKIKASVEAYSGLITCVCFLGGEWCSEELLSLLKFVSEELELKTGLYTGLDDFQDERILKYLDFLKTGPFISELGGLNSKNTNQRFLNIKTGEYQNHLFLKDFMSSL